MEREMGPSATLRGHFYLPNFYFTFGSFLQRWGAVSFEERRSMMSQFSIPVPSSVCFQPSMIDVEVNRGIFFFFYLYLLVYM